MPPRYLRWGVLIFTILASMSLAACNQKATPLFRPNASTLAPDGSLYVMDRSNYRVVHMNAEGHVLNTFGQLGRGVEDIYRGYGMSLDSANNIYFCNIVVSDEDRLIHEEVKVFSPTGKLLREIAVPGNTGRDGCYTVHVDSENRVWVAYSIENSIRVFTTDGKLLATFFGKRGSQAGEFDGLQDVAIDTTRNLLYASDASNSRVQQFKLAITASGEISITHRLSFGTYGREPGQFSYPQYVTVDEKTGELYVGDMGNRRIQVFSPEGAYLRNFAPPDVADWQVQGLTFEQDQRLYAADALNNAIWVFDASGQLYRKIEVVS